MGEWTREALRTSKSHPNRTLKNTVNYEVICSSQYIEKFQFTSIESVDTPEEQVVSDVIMKVLYMGYTKEGSQEFDFTKAVKAKAVKKLQNTE